MIKVLLPNTTSTGIKKTCQQRKLIIIDDAVIRSERLIEFVKEDGTPYVPQDLTERQQFLPKQINVSTEGRFVDLDGNEVAPGTDGAIPEMDWYKTIPIAAVPPEITTIWGAIQWLSEQSMIKGNQDGKY